MCLRSLTHNIELTKVTWVNESGQSVLTNKCIWRVKSGLTDTIFVVIITNISIRISESIAQRKIYFWTIGIPSNTSIFRTDKMWQCVKEAFEKDSRTRKISALPCLGKIGQTDRTGPWIAQESRPEIATNIIEHPKTMGFWSSIFSGLKFFQIIQVKKFSQYWPEEFCEVWRQVPLTFRNLQMKIKQLPWTNFE